MILPIFGWGTWWMPGLDADYVAVIAGGDVTWTPQGLHLNIGQSKHYKLMIDVASCLGIPISYAGKTLRGYGAHQGLSAKM